MASPGIDFDFQRYVDRQKSRAGEPADSGAFGDYAFAGDVRVLRKLDRVKPVRVVATSTVRFWRSFQKNELLGQSVQVTRRQFPELYDAIVACAHTLGIAVPSLYVSRAAGLNAGTYGTDTEAFVLIGSMLTGMLEPAELAFVLGHECGHLHNNHVVYNTAAQFLTRGVGAYLRWAVAPATMALNAWSRRAEITCDRAGLVCARDLEAATSAILKVATGTSELAASINVDDYVAQIDGIKQGPGRFAELFASHPYLPKRIKAMRLFAESSYYRSLIGERGGRPLDEIDREVEELVSVVRAPGVADATG